MIELIINLKVVVTAFHVFALFIIVFFGGYKGILSRRDDSGYYFFAGLIAFLIEFGYWIGYTTYPYLNK